MVYARYIKRGKKTLGPYYYESIKGEDGRIKSVYLGRKPPFKQKQTERPEHLQEQPKIKRHSQEGIKINSIYQEKISKLNKNIELCGIRKKQIRRRIEELVKKQKEGVLSYPRYELLFNTYLKGKSLEYWDDYYDSLKSKLSNKIKKYESISSDVTRLPEIKEEGEKDVYSKVDELNSTLRTRFDKLESLLTKEKVKPEKQSFFDLYEVTTSGKILAFILIVLLITAPGLFLFKDYYSQVVQDKIIKEEKIKLVEENKVGEEYKTFDKTVLSSKDMQREHSIISKIINPISKFFSTPSPTGFAVTEEDNLTLPEERLTTAKGKTKDCSNFIKTDDGMYYCEDDRKFYDCLEFDLVGDEEQVRCIGAKYLSSAVSKSNCPFKHKDCNVPVDMKKGWGGEQAAEDEKYKLAVFNEHHHCGNGPCVVPFYFKSKTSFVGDLLFNISTADTLIENISIVNKNGDNVNEGESVNMEQYDSGYYNVTFDYVPVWSSPTGVRYRLPVKFNITASLDGKKVLELDPTVSSYGGAGEADCDGTKFPTISQFSCNDGEIVVVGVAIQDAGSVSGGIGGTGWDGLTFAELSTVVETGVLSVHLWNASCDGGVAANDMIVYATAANNLDCAAFAVSYDGATHIRTDPVIQTMTAETVQLTVAGMGEQDLAFDVFGSDKTCDSTGASGENTIVDPAIDAGSAVAGQSTCSYNDGNCIMDWVGSVQEGLIASVLVAEVIPNTPPDDPTITLNFTEDNVNFTNASMWCEINVVDSTDEETDMSVDIIIINSTSEFGDYVEQYTIPNAFTGLIEPTKVQWELNQYNFTTGDYVICQARVNDQEAYSSWINSSNLSVLNSVPWWDDNLVVNQSTTEDSGASIVYNLDEFSWDVDDDLAVINMTYGIDAVFGDYNASGTNCSIEGAELHCLNEKENRTGDNILNITALDAHGAMDSLFMNISTLPDNDAPWSDAIANPANINEDSSLNNDIVAVATINTAFQDVEDSPSDVTSCTIDSESDTSAVDCDVDGSYNVDCTTVANQSGSNTVTLNCCDSEASCVNMDPFTVTVDADNDNPWWNAISNNSADANGPKDIVQDSGWQPLGKSGEDFNASAYWWDVEDGQALGIGTGNLTIETNDSSKVICALGENLGSGAGYDGNWSIFCNPIDSEFTGDFIVTLNGSDSYSPPGYELHSFEGYVSTANTAPNAPTVTLNFTEDNINFTNATMWCEIEVTDPESNSMSIDVIVANNTVDSDYVQQWRLDNAFTSVASGSKVQFEIRPDNYTYGDYVICEAVANDGSLDGAYTNSTFLQVQNSLPWWDGVVNQTCTEDDTCGQLINLDEYSHDVDDDLASVNMTYSIVSESGTSIIDCSISGAEMTCTNQDNNKTGDSIVNVSALDGQGGSESIWYNISVMPIDDTPWWDYITNNSISINEDGGSQLVVNVSDYFRDVEDNATPQNLMEPLTNETSVICSYTNDELYCSSESHNGPFIVNITMQDSFGMSHVIQQDFEVTVNAVNDAPVIENITYMSGLGANGALTAGVPTPIIISFLAVDFDGASSIDNGSALLNVSLDGADTRENTSALDYNCYPETIGSNATTAQNYTCTIMMQHWDLGGHWKCTAQTGDKTVNTTKDVSNCFTVGTTLSLNMTSTNITWANLYVGNTDTLMDDAELNITNTGNANISNITLKAYDLIGDTTPGDYIGADNFTATWGERNCDYGQWLINGTNLQILFNGTDTTNNKLNFGEPTNYWTNNATHICLEHVGEGLSQQSYTTERNTLASERYWQITGGTGEI